MIKHFKNINEDKLNMQLIKRDYEEDLVELVLEVFKSLETIPCIKYLSHTVEYDESKINFSRYVISRKKKKKRDENINYQYIKPDRACELTMRFMITIKGISKIVTKSILVPTFDKGNYLTLKGNKYFLLYQLLDSSTYVSKNGLTLKSLRPIILMYRPKETVLTDVNGEEYTMASYFINTLKREISVMLFFFCKMGFSATIKYFNLSRILQLVRPNDDVDEKYSIRFPVNKHFDLCVSRYFFEKYEYVRAITAMIHECFNSKTNEWNIESREYWLEQLGSLYTNIKHKKIESGKSTVVFFERLLDLITKKKLKVSEVNKLSIYSIVYWMIQNFTDLRQKNNMDLNTKRLRLNEYIASMLSLRLADSIHNVMKLGNRANIRQVETRLFKFQPDIVVSVLSTSQLIKYDDRVNDCDFVSALRYTIKGPNSLGNGKSERNISVKYRGTDVSYIGNLDINVYSSSSPGLNGSLTPFAHTSGLYFNEEPEPQNREYEIYQDLREQSAEKGNLVPYIGKKDNPLSYFDTKMKMIRNNHEKFAVEKKRDPGVLYISLEPDESAVIF